MSPLIAITGNGDPSLNRIVLCMLGADHFGAGLHHCRLGAAVGLANGRAGTRAFKAGWRPAPGAGESKRGPGPKS